MNFSPSPFLSLGAAVKLFLVSCDFGRFPDNHRMSTSLPDVLMPRWWDDRCLEHLALKGWMVFWWNLGSEIRDEELGAGWGLLGALRG